MILTGDRIDEEVRNKHIIIEPYDKRYVEPNSYGFHLGNEIIEYDQCDYLDIKSTLNYRRYQLNEEGFILKKGKFYLCATKEKMGSNFYAKTLHARFSTSSMGMWIQFSAPLGHIGAIINWTLEITVTQDVKIYPNMLIGKIAFWKPQGEINTYSGKYTGSEKVVASRIIKDF